MLFFLPTPIGNLGDVSERSLKLFSESKIVFCEDTRVAKSLFNLLQEKYSIHISHKKFISFHSHNEIKILSTLKKEIFDEICIFLSDAGMPCVSDPGSSLVRFCQENLIDYDVLPGANAVLLAYCASGFEGEFTFMGFLPHKGVQRKNQLNKIISSSSINILYESPHRLEKLMEELLILIPNRKIFIIKEATKKFQYYFFGNTQEVWEKMKNSNLKGEWAIVIDKNPQILNHYNITEDDIMSLDIQLKSKAKLLSKITEKTSKEWYDILIKK